MKKKRFLEQKQLEGCGRLYSRVQLAHQIEQSHCAHSNREMKLFCVAYRQGETFFVQENFTGSFIDVIDYYTLIYNQEDTHTISF